jgi:hypothetical protein
MTISDRVYGQINIDEPVILELLASPSLERLRGIDQHGYTRAYWPKDKIISRLEHSIGVFWLLKKYGAPLAEQVAGLIHDISHSAFSHCVDYILNKGNGQKQNHQDNIFPDFVRQSDIGSILEKYGLDLEYLLDDNNFPLKETPLPNLCADRLDYSLRAAIVYGDLPETAANLLLDNLVTKNKAWVFKDLPSAKQYAELFKTLNDKYYTALWAGAMHQVIGDYIGYALDKGYLGKGDLYTTDQEILDKAAFFHRQDKKLLDLSKRLNIKDGFENNPNDYDRIIHLKSRLVDPLFFDQGEVRRFSDIETSWKEILKQELGHKTLYLKFKN